jgi:hypothetical protein
MAIADGVSPVYIGNKRPFEAPPISSTPTSVICD